MAYTVQQYKVSLVKENSETVERRTITNKRDITELVNNLLTDYMLEKVVCIALDGGNRVIGINVNEGTTNMCSVFPAQLMRFLLLAGASSFALAHNHPAGSCRPSQADWDITKKLQIAAKALNLTFIDHLILPDSNPPISMRECAEWRE